MHLITTELSSKQMHRCVHTYTFINTSMFEKAIYETSCCIHLITTEYLRGILEADVQVCYLMWMYNDTAHALTQVHMHSSQSRNESYTPSHM